MHSPSIGGGRDGGGRCRRRDEGCRLDTAAWSMLPSVAVTILCGGPRLFGPRMGLVVDLGLFCLSLIRVLLGFFLSVSSLSEGLGVRCGWVVSFGVPYFCGACHLQGLFYCWFLFYCQCNGEGCL